MMFVYHYVIIPFHPQYLPKHAPLILPGEGAKEEGAVAQNRPIFSTVILWTLHTRLLTDKPVNKEPQVSKERKRSILCS